MTVDDVMTVLMIVVLVAGAVFFAVGGYPAPLISMVVAGLWTALMLS